MIDKPQMGYAALKQTAYLHAPERFLPIVFIPGAMGTRLTDPLSGELAWNPLGSPMGDSPGDFKVNYDRMTQMSAPLVPDETHKAEDDDGKAIRHYSNVIPDFYGPLLKGLAGIDTTPEDDYRVKPRVYCAGYDFRLDHSKAALRLAEVVEEALRETRERKVILVAHSVGGLVARYYCRVLGGESRVLAVILLGSPTLGSPSAFTTLKHGVPGLYLKDMIQADTPKDAIVEGLQTAAAVGSAVSTLAGGADGKVKKAVFGVLGDLYAALCLGAGRYLTRKDTTYFVRQMPALYQVLPHSLFCRDHKNWVIFDPLATGHPPSGFMLLFPTLLDGLTELLAGGLNMFSSPTQKVGDDFKKSVNGFLKPEDAERTSARVHRNAKTIEEEVSDIIKDITGEGGDEPSTDFGTYFSSAKNAVPLVIDIFKRVSNAFVDCTNSRQLYSDIYTGLLDVVDHRAICAANLAIAFRFEEALTINPRLESGVSPLDFVGKLLSPMLTPLGAAAMPVLMEVKNFFIATGGALVDTVKSGDFDYKARKQAAEKQDEEDAAKDAKKKAKEAAEKEKNKPFIYMHPRTVNVYSSSEETETGCILLPTNILSNDDSNVVVSTILPNSLFLALPLLALLSSDHSSGFETLAFGDGTVPIASANPPEELLKTKFIENKELKDLTHMDFGKDAKVVTYVKERIGALISAFVET